MNWDKKFDALKPGDVESHLELAREIIEAGKWSPEAGEMLVQSLSIKAKPGDIDRYMRELKALNPPKPKMGR